MMFFTKKENVSGCVFEIPEGSKTVRAIQNLIISRSLMIR
jgi:hypothetical protein